MNPNNHSLTIKLLIMDSNTSSSKKVDVYAIVTDRIIELLEKGTIPWQKSWTDAGIPMNLLSKRSYRGINLWLLLSLNYDVNLFLTWDQLKKVGASVKQGEHGHMVVFWKTPNKIDTIEEKENDKKQMPLLRYYKVFNVQQIRDLPTDLVLPELEKEHKPIASCEEIVTHMLNKPEIRHKDQGAYYHRIEDYVNMPRKKSFKDAESYYCTLFHELVHSTGHEKRLNRKSITEMAEFGSETYSFEELIAELGAAFLCSSAGTLINQISDSAAYIKGWLSKLKNDKRFIIQASGAAQKAVDYILNENPIENEQKNEIEQLEN
jgi:antirestriction protein ArdC